jgi:hypothetical protein
LDDEFPIRKALLSWLAQAWARWAWFFTLKNKYADS